MAYFYSLRGWLEVEPDNFTRVADIIKRLQARSSPDTKDGLYSSGWNWGETPINWTRYIFYGADVTEEGLNLFVRALDELAKARLNLCGYFHAEGEDGERNFRYRIVDDIVSSEPVGPVVRFVPG